MLRYFPIDAGVATCSCSDLIKIHWQVNKLAAEFALVDHEGRALRVTFDTQTIVRLLDEMPLSTETEPDDTEGLVPNHFAYRVEGATFAATQSRTWIEVTGPVTHYQFVTGWGCMDVLSPGSPIFEVVSIDERSA